MTDATTGYLQLAHVRKAFGSFVAVEDFELAAAKGEFVSFLGPSGCGKTTTLRMIAGFELPTSGRIVLDGIEITNRPPNRRNVGMVFQAYALFPNMTVAGNIGFGLRIRRRPKAEISRRVDELLALIHLEGRGSSYPFQLSGGQQQRVALARALAIEPSVLLLDEPLSALDAKIRVALRTEIRAIQRTLGITTVYVTHDQEEALELSDRVVVMSEGRIEQIGTPFEIYNHPTTNFVASFVGTLNAIPAVAVEPTSGIVRVGDQNVRVSRPLSRPAGSEVTFTVRPEIISLVEAEPGANRLTGALEDITFLGAIVRLKVQVGEAVIKFDTFNNPHLTLPSVGDQVTLTFPAEACLVLEGEVVEAIEEDAPV
jgi:putative spermidine/putrescine transport system ATP-binding protein